MIYKKCSKNNKNYKEYKPKELAKMIYSDEKIFKKIDIFSEYYCKKTKDYKKQYEICKRKDKLNIINNINKI